MTSGPHLRSGGPDPALARYRTSGAPSNEWSTRRVPRGPLPHHEPAPATEALDMVDRPYPIHQPGRLIAAHPLTIPTTLRADLAPPEPRWPTTTELQRAYFPEDEP